jgi:hypothetical protein
MAATIAWSLYSPHIDSPAATGENLEGPALQSEQQVWP